MKKLFTLLIFNFLFLSCSNTIGDLLLRTYNDPDINAELRTDSFTTPYTCYVNWDIDLAADYYILQRKDDSQGSEYRNIYTGTDTSYTDTNLEPNTGYIYRLIKYRGKEDFIGAVLAYGVGTDIQSDTNEPDNTIENAHLILHNGYRCTTYNCTYYDNTTYKDIDWFYVDLEPLQQAHIQLTSNQTEQINFFYSVQNEQTNSPIERSGEDSILLVNPTMGYLRKYFYIVCEAKTGNNAMNFASYTISLISKDTYTP